MILATIETTDCLLNSLFIREIYRLVSLTNHSYSGFSETYRCAFLTQYISWRSLCLSTPPCWGPSFSTGTLETYSLRPHISPASAHLPLSTLKLLHSCSWMGRHSCPKDKKKQCQNSQDAAYADRFEIFFLKTSALVTGLRRSYIQMRSLHWLCGGSTITVSVISL
jgi:hypothetical protein